MAQDIVQLHVQSKINRNRGILVVKPRSVPVDHLSQQAADMVLGTQIVDGLCRRCATPIVQKNILKTGKAGNMMLVGLILPSVAPKVEEGERGGAAGKWWG